MTGGLESFGRVFPGQARVLEPRQAVSLLEGGRAAPGSLLGYGNGRSYGDSCLNAGGALVDMRSARRILSFDPETGILTAEAGAFLSDIITQVARHGWFPPVLPGTQHVTLGGAIANDVHGKNHHRRGSFGAHVLSLTLLRSDGRTYVCSADSRPDLFRATIAGMGLTGLILKATLRLMRAGSPHVVQTVRPFGSLREYFDLAGEADLRNEYAVAWIDQLAGGRAAGRGLLLMGNHADGSEGADIDMTPGRLSVPVQPPFTVLNRPFLRLFNAAYRWKNGSRREPECVPAKSFFFPLDSVGHWNRLYGPGGLFQHQSVVPAAAAREAIPAMLALARRRGQGSFLTVLKRFGDRPSPGILSFPRAGYTLTLDFPNRGLGTRLMLADLDRIAIEAGGAVNPYKDARMPAHVFEASFPDWRMLEDLRDPAFVSDFWRRTALTLDHGARAIAAE
ncbi:FAD-binding oxidoreductase [Aquibium sp. ELW1220]|uniref:FAD-binding oxidoreductase n=1 Tax=Aquibium sp. ELW1220 TaxID=2976766 RepID=UPI0025B25F5D|nr:FAD-binding oxidoreductase [Aquibium sp. ELW1220]MDN2580397.1 FAD-binding oxidoreductase [Aquibium sp. ELW1220]